MNAREIAKLRLNLKAGEWVVVRTKEEILATLDARARLDGMPFQPEMLAFCGKRLRVYKVAHKTCDTVDKNGSRSISDAVHLEGVRCDGVSHSGCQARCLMFWKEAWLERAGKPRRKPAPASAPVCTEETVLGAVVSPGERPTDADPTWVCQTTAGLDMSRPLQWWDPRQYAKDVLTGNHSVWSVVKMLSFGSFRFVLNFGIGYRFLLKGYDAFQKVRGGKPYPHASGCIPMDKPTPTETLDLQPGEMVEVKSPEEIRATLNVKGRNRGMWFDQEMVQYCGGKFPVELRVDRLIDDKTGKLLVMKNPCIQLQGVICKASCTDRRLGCPRATNMYWRELWLKRA
ncbi:MAG TPA: hypothetical protein VJ385_18760 [Fibrobacteria bacterium]|nr:hypothetical protein [Fibrobacteria bacterium]